MSQHKIKPGMRVDLLVNGKSVGQWIVLNEVAEGFLIAQLFDSKPIQIGPVHESILRVTANKLVASSTQRTAPVHSQTIPR